MKRLRVWSSYVKLRITSADPEKLLEKLCQADIPLHAVVKESDLTVVFWIPLRMLRLVSSMTEREGGKIQILEKTGLAVLIRCAVRRPVLLVGIVILIVLSVVLSSHVYFIKVEGNETVSTYEILDAANSCGLKFGTVRREIRSERIKNSLMEQIPLLQWVGVNTKGCVAVISVREDHTAKKEESAEYQNIVAVCDGVIRQMTVTKGNAVCSVGQAVERGELLVSGCVDYGLVQKLCAAEAEVYADTIHEISIISPQVRIEKGSKGKSFVNYRLLIGKKLINLYNSSGISDATCDRIYSVNYLTLPGNFLLPVAVICEQVTQYEAVLNHNGFQPQTDWLENAADNYMVSRMNAGRIIHSQYRAQPFEGALVMDCKYACYEMISQVYNEEKTQNHE